MEVPQYFYWLQLILGIFTFAYLLRTKGQHRTKIAKNEINFIKLLAVLGVLLFAAGLYFVNDYSLGNIYRIFLITLTVIWTIAALYIISKKIFARNL